MPGPAVDAVAQKGVERRADRQRQFVPIREIGQRQANDHVDRPGMKAPVEEGGAHRHFGRALGFTCHRERRAQVVIHGLGDAPEQQADPHPRRKQHRKPGEVAELRLFVRIPQTNIAVAGHQQPQHEADEHAGGKHVIPAQIVGDDALQGIERGFGRVLEEHPEQDERHHHQRRADEHRRVDPRERPHPTHIDPTFHSTLLQFRRASQ